MPIVFVCEDNGFGISVPTPAGWIEAAYGSRPGLAYVSADGSDPANAWPAILKAVDFVREQRRPVFLHLRTVRFGGHAGSDAEISYRKPRDIQADYARDPLLGTASCLRAIGASAADVLARYDDIRAEIDREVDAAPERSTTRLGRGGDGAARAAQTGPSRRDRRTLRNMRPEPVEPKLSTAPVEGPSRLSTDLPQAAHARGVDQCDAGRAADRGSPSDRFRRGRRRQGRGLRRHRRAWPVSMEAARVFDTLLDEQAILGLGLGAGLAGLIPIPEMQYLAYLHNAEDQLRGEGATLPFFSRGRFSNPMVVRVAGLGYQKGFGGHFHNDNAVAVLRDIPGLVVACPARADDAAAMLRTCAAAAIADATLSVFLEPIALYHQRDLYEPGDQAWLAVDHE